MSQHLAALSRDEITAPLVNLVPQDLPGDLYSYVADNVWAVIEKDYNLLTKQEIIDCDNLIDNLIYYKNQINECPLKSDKRKILIAEIIKFKQDNKELIAKASSVFWMRITEKVQRRKIIKR